MSELLIGVDGGGTLCRAALLRNGERVEAEAPGANAMSDFKGCLAAVTTVLEALRTKAGLAPEDFAFAPAYLGLAGVTAPEIADRLARALPLRRLRIEEDRYCAVTGALGPDTGCLAALGTGSFLARQSPQGIRFQGGYGLALGDEASGAWLGREALSTALRAADGWGKRSPLTNILIDAFKGPQGVMAFAASASPQAFARLAPHVTQAAQLRDPQAVALMRRGADYIAEGLAALGWQDDPVTLTGGLGPAYTPFLPDPLRNHVIPPQGTALDGALTLAARMSAQP